MPFRSHDPNDPIEVEMELNGWPHSMKINNATEASGGSGDVAPPTEPVPVSIYIADEAIHEQVEQAVVDLLARAELVVESREDPVFGSWSLRMRARVKEGAKVAAHVADTKLVLAQDAVVTATLLQNLGPVIASLQPTKDAVIRMGAVLLVKVDWVVTVYQLTADQQWQLDHQPGLALSPSEIIAALNAESARERSPAELE